MAVSRANAIFRKDIESVWAVVTSLKDFSWRSDLCRVEILDENQFIEYTTQGYATTFTTTVYELCKRWEFDMENGNMKGHWTGIFTQTNGHAKVELIEDVTAKKLILKPFVKAYLKKQQALYIRDLTRKMESLGE